MARAPAAVAGDVQVPAVLGGDHADVLALRLGAFPGAAGHAHLDLVRRAQAPVALLQQDRHPDRVLHAVPAPGGSDARLHRAQRLAVRLTRLHPGIDDAPPDLGQVVEPGTQQVDALTARDLRVQVEVLGDGAERDQLVRGDLTTRHPGHDRVGAVALHVGEVMVVGVLHRCLVAAEHVPVAERCEDRGDVGRQISQPAATTVVRRARRSRSCTDGSGRGRTTRAATGRSARRARSTPPRRGRASSDCMSVVTAGTHPPQLVPAHVAALTSPRVWHPFGDRVADRADRHRVAAAQQCAVGELALVRRPYGRRQHVGRKVVGLGGLAERDGGEQLVSGGVTDERAADAAPRSPRRGRGAGRSC